MVKAQHKVLKDNLKKLSSKNKAKQMVSDFNKVKDLQAVMEHFAEVIQENIDNGENESAVHNMNFFMQVFTSKLHEEEE